MVETVIRNRTHDVPGMTAPALPEESQIPQGDGYGQFIHDGSIGEQALRAGIQESQQDHAQTELLGRLDHVEDLNDNYRIIMHSESVYKQARAAIANPDSTIITDELPPKYFELSRETPAYEKLVEKARSIDTAEALDELAIEGDLADLPFELTADEIKLFLQKNLPPMAYGNVSRIEFRDMTAEENPNGSKDAETKFNYETGKCDIVVNTQAIHIRHLFRAHSSSNEVDDAAVETKIEMMEDLVHEFGHALSDALPVAALERWEKMIQDDHTDISSYVKETHEGKEDQLRGEDFAESLMLFVFHPETLHLFSFDRHIGMKALYREFMPAYQDSKMRARQLRRIAAQDAIIDSGEKTYDEVREEWFWFEQEPTDAQAA